MTISGYHMVMREEISVNIAELKARLSHYLKIVRSGRTVTVLDRDTPVAKIITHAASQRLRVRKATRDHRKIKPMPPTKRPIDSLALLLEDRNSR